MQIEREKAVINVSKHISEFSLQDLIKSWNDIFPHEEQICEKTFEKMEKKEIEMLKDELAMIVVDEISSYSNDDLSEAYVKMFDEDEIEIIDEINIEEEDF